MKKLLEVLFKSRCGKFIFCKPHTKPVARRSKFTRVPYLYPASESIAVKVLATSQLSPSLVHLLYH